MVKKAQAKPMAVVYEQSSYYGEWAVEFIPNDADGTCEKALFDGPRAQEQAFRYAAHEYGSFIHNVDLRDAGVRR